MLETLFAEARISAPPAPSAALMARVLDDAYAQQNLENPIATAPGAPATAQPVKKAQRVWMALVAAVGGWPSLGGLAMAGVAGFFIGICAGPTIMAGDLAGSLLSGGESYLTEFDASYAYVQE